MKVVLTPLALNDLEQIGDQIARRNPDRAATFVVELRTKAMALGDFPLAGAPRTTWGEGVRITLHGNYLIVYRVVEETVEILRIVHGARNLDALFEQDDEDCQR